MVVLIIGILAAIAVPQYQLAVDKAPFSYPDDESTGACAADVLYCKWTYAKDLDALDVSIPYKSQSFNVLVMILGLIYRMAVGCGL